MLMRYFASGVLIHGFEWHSLTLSTTHVISPASLGVKQNECQRKLGGL